jgi:hypothetical protein
MMDVLSSLALADVARVARRTALAALIVGIIALVVLGIMGMFLAGVGGCLGIMAAMINFRMVVKSAGQAAERMEPGRKAMHFNTLLRMGVLSVIGIGLLIAVPELGVGMLIGLAVFQVMLLASLASVLLAELRSNGGTN